MNRVEAQIQIHGEVAKGDMVDSAKTALQMKTKTAVNVDNELELEKNGERPPKTHNSVRCGARLMSHSSSSHHSS